MFSSNFKKILFWTIFLLGIASYIFIGECWHTTTQGEEQLEAAKATDRKIVKRPVKARQIVIVPIPYDER